MATQKRPSKKEALLAYSCVFKLGFSFLIKSGSWILVHTPYDIFLKSGRVYGVLFIARKNAMKVGPHKSAIKDHIRACAICCDEKYTVNSFQILNRCHTEDETKIQEALLIKKLNPRLNKQLYAKGASFLHSIF